MRFRQFFLFLIATLGCITLQGSLVAINRFMQVLSTGNSKSVIIPPVAYAAAAGTPGAGTPPTATLTLSYIPDKIFPGSLVTFTVKTNYFTDSSKVTLSFGDGTEKDVALRTRPGNVEKTVNVSNTYKNVGTYTVTAKLWYTSTVALTVEEKVSVQYKVDYRLVYLPIVFIPQKPTKIRAQALPRIPANGQSTYNVTAQLFDQGGQSLPNHPVTVVASSPGIGYNETQKDMTDAQGRITTTLRAPLVTTSIAPIPVTVQVTAGVTSTTLSGYAYPPTKITWASDKMEILADGADTTTIKATVFDDADVPVSSYPVQFQVGGGSVSPTEGKTNANGVLPTVVQPRTRPGAMMVYAWAGVLASEPLSLDFKIAPCNDDETRNNSVLRSEPPWLGWQNSLAPWIDGICTGSLERDSGELENDDYYAMEFNAGDTVTAKLLNYPFGQTYDLFLFSPEVKRGARAAIGTEKMLNKEFTYTIPAGLPGTYYLRVYKTSGPPTSGTYTLDVVIQRANP